MPPKSSHKKVALHTWFFCDYCKVHITSKDRETHDKVCPITVSEDFPTCVDKEFILKDALYTCSLDKRGFNVEALSDVASKYINSLLFVSEGAMQLCKFCIGENVVVESLQSTLPPLVRAIWPIPEKFLTTVFVSPEDYTLNWQNYKHNFLRVKKLLTSDVLPAKCVKLQPLNEELLDPLQLQHIEHLLKISMKNLHYTKGSIVPLNFYNKLLKFKVLEYSSVCENDELLEKSLERLTLKLFQEKFVQVIQSTHIEIDQKIQKQENMEDTTSSIKKSDIGGLDNTLEVITESMQIALGLQNIIKGVKISRGMLIFGPTGCGKTMICEAMANSVSASIIRINSSDLFSKYLGETEKNLQEYFDQAYRNYPKPTLVIVEDVHNICPKYESSEVVKRSSVAFLNMLDSLHLRTDGGKTFLLATTGSVDALNPGIRRCGRLDCEIEVPAPSPKGRLDILKCLLKNTNHELKDEDISDIANTTHGFVGSDLSSLIYSSALVAYKENHQLKKSHVFNSLLHVKPSAMREVLIESPNVKWSDIGGQQDLKLKLKQAIEWPLIHPEKFKQLGIQPPRGILMFGPPGCSKTMIAKALATESQVNFLSIKGPELFSMWVGESERAVREVFRKARQVSPSIIFFDEIDAIGSERSSESGSSVKERVLTQLLTELDGVSVLKNVTIVAATNRPDLIDKALLRPGRIDQIVYVGLPDAETRRDILKIKLRQMPVDKNVEIEKLVELTEGYSGAEIQAVCHEAAMKTIEQDFDAQTIQWSQFEYALKSVQPRTSPDLLQLYEQYLKQS